MDLSKKEILGISVVIPTHGRADLVESLLSSLHVACQAYHGNSEILIIDSSTGEQQVQIKQFCGNRMVQYHLMENNVRAKRNWGVQHAQFPIVLFIDSDCQASENLLIEHAQIYENINSPQLGGVVGLTYFVGSENWVWQIIKRASTLDAFSFAENNERVPWGPTCNISYRRDVIMSVGLFDTSFPFALGGDDTDLGVRVTDAGFYLATNRYAIVNHEKRTWSSISLIGKRLFRWGRMHFYMMCKHSHRTNINPPTVLTTFLLLMLIFIPLGSLIERNLAWVGFPFLWFFLVISIESFLISKNSGKQPSEFFFAIGARLLGLVFQAGTIFEGLKNFNFMPFYKDVSYNPPSPKGRKRGISQMWAMVIAFPISIILLLLIQLTRSF